MDYITKLGVKSKNCLLNCLNEIKDLYMKGFDDFMTLIEENKVQDALSWADTFKWNEDKLYSRRQEVREKVRKLAGQQLKDPVTAFKLLDILQKWQLNSVALDSLQHLDLELNLLISLIQGKHFCEFWELLSQIQLRVIPRNFNYKNIHLFNMYEREVHKLRKDCCEKIITKCSEISKLLLPPEIKTKMNSEIFAFQRFKEELKKQEEEMRTFLNDVLSEPLQELTAKVKSPEQQSNTQEVALQQLRENKKLKKQLHQLSSSINKMEQRFESLIEERVNRRAGGIQKQFSALQDLCFSQGNQILKNQKQNNQCEEECKKAMEGIRQITSTMKSKSGIEDRRLREVDKERRNVGPSQRNIERILQAFQDQQRFESEKMMGLLRVNLQRDFKTSESLDSSPVFSIRHPGPHKEEEEEKIQAGKRKEEDPEERERLDFDQQENEGRREQISENAFQQNDKDDVSPIQAINSNTWEVLGSDQG